MAFNKVIRRELEVAFSKHSQPLWLRILKYILLVGMIWFFWESKLFWIILVIVLFLSLLLHFWYRYKTNGWTKTYGGWKYDKDKTNEETK